MGPLAIALQRWRGPEFVRERVEHKGYRAHVAELEFMRAEFGAAANDLPKFWNEAAREMVSSAGIDGDRGTRIAEPGYYRSTYLDDQQRQFLKAHPEYGERRGTHRHEVYHLWHQYRGKEAQDFGLKHIEAIEAAKAPEVEALLGQSSWTGERKEFPTLVDETAKAAGFGPFSRRRSLPGYIQKGWDKTTTDGLCFEIRADMGARYALSGRLPSHREGIGQKNRDPRQYDHSDWLPLMFSIRHVDDPEGDLFLGSYEIIFPDLSIYRAFSTIEGGILGVRALTAVFAAMHESLA